MVFIQDGKGSGVNAKVNKDQQLVVRSIMETEMEQVSEDKGEAFTWASTFVAVANDEIIYIKNTSDTKKLLINSLIVGNTANTRFTLFEVTGGTAAGTTITGKNINLSASNVASTVAFGNAAVTGTLTGETIACVSGKSWDLVEFNTFGALILGKNDAIAITSSANGTINTTIFGYFIED